MKKFKMIQLINKVETRIEETVLSKKIKTEIAQMLLDVKNEAINYTRCCETLKSKEVMTFNEWIKVKDFKLQDDGTYLRGITSIGRDIVRKKYIAYYDSL